MKKIFLGLSLIVILSGICQTIELPNIESSFFGYSRGMEIGFSSKVLSVKDLDIRFGGLTNEIYVLSFGSDLKKVIKVLNIKLGWEITYLWQNDDDIAICLWTGYDFKSGKQGWENNLFIGIQFVFGNIKL